MSKRRRQGLAPSLFPFLAVLVCTLGTLILLLALVAQNATDVVTSEQAKAETERVSATEEKPPTKLSAAAVEAMIDEEKFRVQQLVAFRDEQTNELGRRKDQLTHLEDHIRRLREKLQQISQQMEIATGATKVDEVEVEELVRLRDKVQQQSDAVEELKNAKQDATPRVVIVPHKGPNGTDRRPVYLECDVAGLTIWPEGTRITISQLEDADFSANPLDAALRVIRHHAMQYYGDAGPPYPLLVVRPDGIETYSAARRAMLDWDDQFGYELIPAGVKLAFNQPDSQLRKRIDVAVRDAVLKQQARNAIVSRSGYGPGYPGNRSSGALGNSSSGARRRFPTLSAKSMDQAGRDSGFRDHRDDQFAKSRYANPAYGSNNAYRGGNGVTGADAARQLDERLRTAIDELADGGSDSLTGSAPGPTGNGEALPGSNDPLSGSGGSYADLGTLAQDNRDQRSNPFVQSPQDASPKRDLSVNADASSSNHSQHRDRLADASLTGEMRFTDESPLTGESIANANQAMNGNTRYTMPSEFDVATNADTELTNGSARTGNPSPLDPSNDRTASNRDESQAASSLASNANASSSAMSLGSRPAAGQPGTQSDSSSSDLPQQISSSISASQMLDREPVRRQGANWALPRDVAASHGNAIVRTIRVQCFEDRFVLLPSNSVGATEFFGFSDGDITRATLQLATSIRDRIELWGAAIPGGRWQPRLDVEVMPRGETRFHQLRTLMNGSGVEVNGRASR